MSVLGPVADFFYSLVGDIAVMGEARRRIQGIGRCIYCGSTDSLSREHVIPFGLGGDLVLRDATCPTCANETSKLELRLLRGHWWPYRQFLGLPSRRAGEVVPDVSVTINRSDGTRQSASLPMTKQSVAMIFDFDPPSILKGKMRNDSPNASRVAMKNLTAFPSVVQVDGSDYRLRVDEKLEIPINYDAADLCRFLAKVAHGYAISRRGMDCCSEFLLPQLILGKTEGAQSFVGGSSSALLGHRLPGCGLHAMMDRVNNGFVTVYIQLFRDRGDPPPIYEVVVGRL
jgi:hypothetical protein